MDNYKARFTEEDLWEIIDREHESAQVIEDNSYQDDWWMYHDIVFTYEGIHYVFTYREHVSPNIVT